MKYSMCKSSMESHIQHCIASSFSEVSKAYSRSTIQTNLKLQEMYLNGIDIIEYYLNTYNSDDDYVYNNVDEKEVNFSIFEKPTSNIPVASSSNPTSLVLHKIANYA